MSRDKLRTIGFMVVVIFIAVTVIWFDDIRAMMDETMVEQADSLMDQLLR